MQNLAGHKDSTRICREELLAAGIPTEALNEPYGEPQSWVGGTLNGFTFRRAWYYWIVEGPMPLDTANRLYADPIGARDVRAAGHCGCPLPGEWAEYRDAAGVILEVDPDGKQQAEWEALIKRHPGIGEREAKERPFRFVTSIASVPGAKGYVMSYHVDSAEGLRLIADAIRSLAAAEKAA